MKKKLLNGGKGKFLKRLFSAMLVIALLSTGTYTDVSAGGRTLYSDAVQEDTGTSSGDGARRLAAKAGGTDIFDNTSITLYKFTLQAGYEDENGRSHTVDLAQNGNYELPYNADINMRLDFMLGDFKAITPGQPYIYRIPDGIRVDVETDHKLADNESHSIGDVHISKDGTLTFVFNNEIYNLNVPFYVQFEGGLSQEYQSKDKHVNVKFPTASGSYDFSIDTIDKKKDKEKPQPGDVTMSKYGSRIIKDNGRNYIEWTVALEANGKDYITGTIHDDLPSGLTYAPIDGYPKLSGEYAGEIENVNIANGGKSIDIDVTGIKTYYRANVTFCTYYDESIWGNNLDKIDANTTSNEIANTAIFEPADGSKSSEGEGKVTIRPDMLSKSGTRVDADGNITWTVVINRENLNIGQLDYTDIIEDGQELKGNVKVEPGLANGSVLTQTANGFVIDFSNTDDRQTYKLTYTTHVTDLAKRSFKNSGELKGSNGVEYDVKQDATVPGVTLIQKNCTDYNSITNLFTWEIIVNPEEREMNDVVVTDTFDPSFMTFVSATGATIVEEKPGEIKFDLGNITKKQTITVVTQINPDNSFNENDWIGFKNQSYMRSSLNKDDPVEAEATRYIQVTKPDLIDKSWIKKDDGTVEWTIVIKKPQLTVKGLALKDTIPEGMEYVDGTFRLENRYWYGNTEYRNPTINGRTITYELTEDDSKFYSGAGDFADGFAIRYSTKVSNVTDATDDSKTYTNHAEVSIDYEGGVTLKDEDESTVEGVVGGILDKTYAYRRVGDNDSSGRDVEWTVTINGARNDMGNIENPKIYDDLADYFDYVEGKLYTLDTRGNRTEVPADKYTVTVINGRLIVQLPQIDDKCYQFVFTTRFNCLSARELEGKNITNTVVFEGDGMHYVKESGSVDNVNFSSSSAGSSTKREIRVKKVDSADHEKVLEGAKFELLLNGEVIGEATSGADGYAVFKNHNNLLGCTLSLREVQAPAGYKISEKGWEITDYVQANIKTDTNGVQYYELVAENDSEEEIRNTADIRIKKVTEGDIVGGTTTVKVLSGATIGLYSDADCSNLKATKTTNASGEAVFSGCEEGEYYVKEITPPQGYKLLSPDKAVAVKIDADPANPNNLRVTYDGTAMDVYEMMNTPAVGNLQIKKVAKGSTVGIAGASFSIYSDSTCRNRVAYGTTGDDGTVTLSGLELGRTYYYKETNAPTGYVLDSTVHSITVGKGTETADQTKEIVVENELATGNIVITKTDDSIPAKPLSGVKFVLLKNGQQMGESVTTDDAGVAVFKGIPFGDYTIREEGGIVGYAVAADKGVTVKQAGNTEVTMVNKVIKCDIRIVKVDEVDQEIVLSGAKFGLYNTQSGRQMASGVTDRNGVVVFRDIPYGEYYLKELNSPEGYKLATETVPITAENIETAFNRDGGVLVRTITNKKENGSIQLKKVGKTDSEDSYESLEGALFTLLDENKLPKTTAISDADGKVEFTELPYGTYYVEETRPPAGYVRNTTMYKVVVRSDFPAGNNVTDEKNDAVSVTDEGIFEVINKKANSPYISVRLKKIDSDTKDNVPNATFVMYKTCDGQTSEMGTAVTGPDGIAYFRRIHIDNDDVGTKYTIKETVTPTGYHAPKDEKIIDLGKKYADGETANDNINKYADEPDSDGNYLSEEHIPWVGGYGGTEPPQVAEDAIVENEPIKGRIQITKTAMDGTVLDGVEYKLYQEVNGEKLPYKINEKEITAVTKEGGIATFTDLPCGIYYVRETKAPAGYTLNEKEVKVVIVDDKEPEKVTFKDAPIEIWISKQAVGGNAEIAGAQFNITEQGAPPNTPVIDSWTTSDQRPHRVITGKMQIGKTYVLSEMKAPDGYSYMPDVEFTVNPDGSISTVAANVEKNGQTLIVRDRPINLTISKQAGDVSGELANATLAILDANGKEVHRFITNGIAPYEVPVGILEAPESGYNVYTLTEISAPDDYELADDIKFSIDKDGVVYEGEGGKRKELVDAPLVMVDMKKVPFYLRKVDANTGLDVPGAKFQLYGADGPTGPGLFLSEDGEGQLVNGKPIKIGEYIGGVNGEIYTLEETKAPDGYLKASNIKFKYTYDEDKNTYTLEIVEGSKNNLNAEGDTLMIYDSTIELKIRKQDSYGLILSGAELELSEYDKDKGKPGQKIDDITTTDGVYTVSPSLLVSGKDYILHEVTAPNGYQTTGDIIFHIAENGVITRDDKVEVINNTIVMEDEVGLSIGKFDLDHDNIGLAECELKLESEDDRWWKTTTWKSTGDVETWDIFDFTPGCTYILTEMKAPMGYAYTNPITFTIDKDTHQVYYIIDGEPELAADRIVKIKDGKIQLTVSKQNSYSKVEVPGAQLSILDKEGKTLASWTSGSEPCEVDTSQLIAGNETYEEYILREVTEPNGYYKAVDIPFAIDRDGNIYLDEAGNGQYDTLAEGNMITMYDDPMLSVEKLDTSGNRVVGAKLTITAKDDPNFEPVSWETTQEIYSFEDGNFTPGVTYILTETMAPYGYGYAQSLEFMVTADNKLYVNGEEIGGRRIVMIDYPIKVLVSKQDGGNRQSLAGAKLVIKDETGKGIHTFTSTGEPVLLPNTTFKSVQGGLTYYKLSETEAPDGYRVAPDIEFAIDSSGNLLQKDEKGSYVRRTDNTLVMLDYAGNGGDSNNSSNPNTDKNTNKNTSSVSSNTTNAPKTGDSTPLGTLIALCAAGFLGAGIIFGLYFRRRRRRS